MTLVHVMGSYWHWVERDLIALGFCADDIGTPKLTLWQLISIVVAAPIGSAVREKLDGGWSKTDQLIANLAEQQAGVLQLTGRYPRPGIAAVQGNSRSTIGDWKPIQGVKFQAFDTPEAFLRKRSEYMQRNQLAAQQNPEAARERMVSGGMGKRV